MNKKKPTGFTIVELLVVIVVIGILMGLTIVGYTGWRERTAKNEVQSDLKGAMSAMESARNFGAGYPVQASPPVAFSISTFDESTNVDLTYISGSATVYCLKGASTAVPTVIYYVNPPTVITPTTTACT